MPGLDRSCKLLGAALALGLVAGCGLQSIAPGALPPSATDVHWATSAGDVELDGARPWPGDTAAAVRRALPARVWARVADAYRAYSYWAIGYGAEGPTLDARGHPLAIRTDSVRPQLDSIARWARIHRAEPVGCVVRDSVFMHGDTVVAVPLTIASTRYVVRADSVSALVASPVCEGRYPYLHGHLAFVRRLDALPERISASDSAVARRSKARYHVLEIIDTARAVTRVWAVNRGRP